MTPPSAFAELDRCLARTVERLGRLGQLAEEKQRLIMERRGRELVPLLEEEAQVAQEVARLEEERQALVQRLGVAGEGGPASAWLERIPAGLQPRMRELVGQLRERVERLAAQNAVNESLLREELAYVRFALETLAGPSAEDFVYRPGDIATGGTHPGREGAPPGDGAGRPLFDFKV